MANVPQTTRDHSRHQLNNMSDPMAIPINPFAHIRVQDDDDDCEIADERCCDIADERQDVFLPDDLRNNQNGLNGVYEEKKYKKATDVDEAHE